MLARAWLQRRGLEPRPWAWVGLVLDVLLISLAVQWSGGSSSELALLYFWPLAVAGIRRRWSEALSAGLLSAAAYSVVAWPQPGAEAEQRLAVLATRICVLLFATSLSAWFAYAEARRLEELSSLREELALARYREDLSREMHDGIQHYLVSMSLQLELAAKRAEASPREALSLALDQRFTLRQAAEELRYLVRRLRSDRAVARSFAELARTHLTGLAGGRDGLRLVVEGEERPLPASAEHAVLRILQEAVTNAAKHARAECIEARVAFAADALECAIRDDGVGFDPDAVEEGSGLAGMLERAASVGAELDIRSEPSGGTVVRVRLPLPPGSSAKERP